MFTDLLPKFESLAYQFSGSTLESPEDLQQEMILSCLEKANKDPEFFNQTESYIVHQGRMRAWYFLRERDEFERYQYYVTENEDGESELDLVVSDELNPEVALIHKQELESVVKTVEGLSGQEKTVVMLAVAGVTTGEIAKRLGVSTAAVCSYKTRAANKVRFAVEVN